MSRPPRTPAITRKQLDAGDELVARGNLTRWLAQENAGAELTRLEADYMPGYLMLTATMSDGRVATCLLDLAVKFRDPKTGKDDIWPWSWRA
jgi:hypothetical protein